MRSTVAYVLAAASLASCGDQAAPSPVASGRASASSPPPVASAPKPTHREIALQYGERIVAKDFAGAVALLGPELAKAVPAADVERVWVGTFAEAGEPTGVDSVVFLDLGEADVAIVRVKLARATMSSKLTLAKDGDRIVGLHTDGPVLDALPDYADASKVEARDVVIGSGRKVLPGVLTVPVGVSKAPAVVLVHGSGPGDRDESLGEARPFRDLAFGLTTRGIAVLRWDKRTRGYAQYVVDKLENLTIKEEYDDDVAAAIALLRSTPSIDPDRVFVVGHSEGGMLTPRFVAADPKLAGGIVLAGNARRFEDLLVPQLTYIAKVDGMIDPFERIALDGVKDAVAMVKSPALDANTSASDLPLDIPAKYWLGLRGYDQVAVAKTLTQPLLFVQGGRDYQVTETEDIPLWRKGLAGKKNVTFKIHPNLNHMMIDGKGMATPDEYMHLEGHVAKDVIEEVAAFVNGR